MAMCHCGRRAGVRACATASPEVCPLKRIRRGARVLAALLIICLALAGCRAKPSGSAVVLLDGERWEGGSVNPASDDPLRVYVTLDGTALIDLPFGEAHSVTVTLPDGGENAVRLTGEAVFMESANCENHDCVDMGAVTRENLELRVMGGFIVCLPHRVSVEVRAP